MSFPFPGNQERQTANEMAEYLTAYVLELNQSFADLHLRAWESDPQAVEAALQAAHEVAARAVSATRQPEAEGAAAAPPSVEAVEAPKPEPISAAAGDLASIRAVIEENSQPAAATAQQANVFPIDLARSAYEEPHDELAA